MIIILSILAAVLVCASVGISVLNWASMPSPGWGEWVAIAIALGVEGAKLFLVPYARYVWRKDFFIAISSLVMGAVMTVISVGGIVIWMDNNLTFNAAAKARVDQVDAINAARIDLAVVLVSADKASKADMVLDKVDLAKEKVSTAKPVGLVIPFNLTDGQRWTLLTGIAVTIDLGAILLITILSIMVRCRIPLSKTAERREVSVGYKADHVATFEEEPFVPEEEIKIELVNVTTSSNGNVGVGLAYKHPELKPREQELRDLILIGKYGRELQSISSIAKDFKIRPASVRTVLDKLLAEGKLEEIDESYHLCTT